jgi:hypothetical protein
MTASDRNSRRADKAELARNVTATETLAFMTALMAFLKEAEAGHHGTIDVRPPPAEAPVAPAHPIDPLPADAAAAEHRSIPGDQHSDASAPGSSVTPPAVHVDATTEGGGAHVGATTDVAVAQGSLGGSVATDAPVAAAMDHGLAPPDAHAGTTPPAAIEPTSLQELGGTITDLVTSSLSTVSRTLDSLTTTVTQLTSTVTGTVGQLTDGVTGLVGDLLHSVTDTGHDAPSHNLVDALVTDIVSSPLEAPHDDTAVHTVDIAGLDTAGAVPTAALPPLSLHLGFLGQPTSDGHDMHDGAFSALGVHHF